MKLKFVLFTVLVFALSFGLNAHSGDKPISLKYGIEISRVDHNVFVATDTTFHNSKVLIVKLKDGTVIIASSPFESLGTESMMGWITKTMKPKKMIAINTHYHLDGSSGNAVYHKYGVATWASDHTDRLHRENGQKMRESVAQSLKSQSLSQRILSTKVVPASFIFEEKKGKTFEFPDETVEVIYPGPSHSPDHVVVYFKKRKILFGGCMIKPGKTLGYLGDANVKSWVLAVTQLLQYDVKTVVPGHHQVGGKKLIVKTIENAKSMVSIKK